MWFKQRKTITAIIEATIEPPMTADGHRLDEMVVCFDCGNLVHKDKAKEVKHCYPKTSYCSSRAGWVEIKRPERTFHHCLTHAPVWDVVSHHGYTDGSSTYYYRRIPAVPERLEEIVEAPKRKARPKKEAK